MNTPDKRQLALNSYIKSDKSGYEIGLDYERYVGYLYETQGFHVEFSGAIMGKTDLGRDLIVYMPDEILVVQCKRWSKNSLIHEKHLHLLYGTVGQLRVQRKTENITGAIYTTASLSDAARLCAKELGVKVYEKQDFPEYPRIKCIVSKTGEHVYYLPFDKQYDNISVNISNDGKYVNTVKAAEQEGFRWVNYAEEKTEPEFSPPLSVSETKTPKVKLPKYTKLCWVVVFLVFAAVQVGVFRYNAATVVGSFFGYTVLSFTIYSLYEKWVEKKSAKTENDETSDFLSIEEKTGPDTPPKKEDEAKQKVTPEQKPARYIKKSVFACVTAALCVAFVCCLAYIVYQQSNLSIYEDQIVTLNRALQQANRRVAAIEIEAQDTERLRSLSLSSAERKIAALEASVQEAEQLADEMRDLVYKNVLDFWPEFDFFRRQAAIVTTQGNRYHHYGCQHISNRRYYIYNIEAAKSRGYTPCLDCWEDGLWMPFHLPPRPAQAMSRLDEAQERLRQGTGRQTQPADIMAVLAPLSLPQTPQNQD